MNKGTTDTAIYIKAMLHEGFNIYQYTVEQKLEQ